MNETCFCLIFVTLFTLIICEPIDNVNAIEHSPLKVLVSEHEPSLKFDDVLNNSTRQSITERTLIRVTRLNEKLPTEKPIVRSRRQVIEAIQTAGFVINVAKAMKNTENGEEIFGMAKTVGIVIIVISSLCIVCCLVTTIVICVKCCCGNKNRKRDQTLTTVQVPQPIFVQTGPTGYQPQYYQQQAPRPWSPTINPPPESRPMLPQPSAPPQQFENQHVEYPPPSYEKLYKAV